MIKTARELLPLAIGVAIVSGFTWFLLARGWALGPWLVAVLLFAHGWVHLMFVFPRPAPTAAGPTWPFDMGRSWLITAVGLDERRVRVVGRAVMVVTVGGFALSALSTVGLLVPVAWWTGLLVGSSLASMVMLGIFLSPTLLLGWAIDVALPWFAIASIWSPAAAG